MSVKYSPVLWNGQKKMYDKILAMGIGLFVLLYVGFQLIFHPTTTVETIIIRVTALSAFILLHLILMIGPLARIDNRFLPLIYNRRHAGVSMFFLALVHSVFCIIQFHSLGDTNPLISLFTSNAKYGEISQFPFQTLGFFALLILFLMAVTSHDFWLKNLNPKFWKALHMMVYFAYILIVLHVATGALQYESHKGNWALLFIAFTLIVSLHIYAGLREVMKMKAKDSWKKNGEYTLVCTVEEIDDQCAKTVILEGENIAIFKYDNKISAINNVCKHQMGPLGEGKIIDGCITCPWHGYQYLPENGQSPPPFKEKVKTYTVKVSNNEVWVNPSPNNEGSYVEAAKF